MYRDGDSLASKKGEIVADIDRNLLSANDIILHKHNSFDSFYHMNFLIYAGIYFFLVDAKP